MSEIRLDDATINVDGEWLSVDELTARIQEKMQGGDMNLTNLAAALEELNTALENSRTLNVRVVITKEDYQKLRSIGGEDDLKCIYKAVSMFIGNDDPPAVEETTEDVTEPEEIPEPPEKVTVNCPHPQCMSPIEVATDERPVIVECPNCGISGRLTEEDKWAKIS